MRVVKAKDTEVEETSTDTTPDILHFDESDVSTRIPRDATLIVTPGVIEDPMRQLQTQLDEALDKSLTKWRKGYGKEKDGSPKMLEYLEWHTVTRQFNRIFGPGNWSWDVSDIKTLGEDPKSGVPCVVTATATVTISWPNHKVTSYTNNGVEVVKAKEIWEGGRPSGKFEPRTWEAFEMAFKGAAHDAFKRAATALGEQFGLSLYVKEEETKAERSTTVTAAETAKPAAATRTAESTSVPDEDDVAYCEACDREIRGYTHKTTGKVYTTQDLVDISKRKYGGQTLCYSCGQKAR